MCLLAFSIVIPCEARIKRKKNAQWSTTLSYVSYTDLKQDSSTDDVSLEPAYDMEIAYRMLSVFQFIGVINQSQNSLRSSQGLGLRIDFPGFFLLWASPRQVRYNQKWQPITTSVFGQFFQSSNKAEENGVEEDASGSEMGFTIDTFLFNPYVYLRLQASLMNQQGNSFSAYTAGLGWEF